MPCAANPSGTTARTRSPVLIPRICFLRIQYPTGKPESSTLLRL
jgi:hypothetical protein